MRILAKFLLLVTLIAAADAEAKVCFLPGVLNGDGCIDNSSWLGTGCQGYDRTTPCPEGRQEQTCIYEDRTYYRCSCKSDNVLNLENGKYICTGTFDSECGCAGSETFCNPARYPYESCADYTNASGSGDSCRSPADGSIRYEECACSRTVYPYNCNETGLKEPSGTDYCEAPDGSRWYPYCICDDSYSTEECSSRTDGCTTLVEQVYNGHDNCYLCSAETCSEENQINLEAYWCNVTQTTVTDCATLGYVKVSKCDDGTTGVKCPFDSSYMYCPGQEESGDEEVDCSAYPLTTCPTGAICSECKNSEGVFVKVDSCESGYVEMNNSCVRAYASCEAAGYFSDDTNRSCSGTAMIYLNNGNQQQCYTGCSCESGYAESDNQCLPATCDTALGESGSHYVDEDTYFSSSVLYLPSQPKQAEMYDDDSGTVQNVMCYKKCSLEVQLKPASESNCQAGDWAVVYNGENYCANPAASYANISSQCDNFRVIGVVVDYNSGSGVYSILSYGYTQHLYTPILADILSSIKKDLSTINASLSELGYSQIEDGKYTEDCSISPSCPVTCENPVWVYYKGGDSNGWTATDDDLYYVSTLSGGGCSMYSSELAQSIATTIW